MKKILIFKPINSVCPKGGPAGYLYNLKSALDNLGYKVDFLAEENIENKSNIKRYIPKRILDFLRAIKYKNILSCKKKGLEDWNKYDVIHFHETTSMYYYRDFLNQYKGIVVLTSHSPCAYHKELISQLNKFDYKIFKKELDKMEQIDEYAFKRANYIIFPCKEAEEPYYHSWNRYKKVRDESKIRYLYTGIDKCIYKKSKNEIREKYGLSKEDFVIGYVGRHNEIKGYDDFIKIGTAAIEKENIKVLVAGKEGKIKAPNDSNWIEVGWTNDPYSIINAVDVFVLPNKETYFDIVMLEVMSLGKIILTTYTGGNKVFSQFEDAGVFFYNNESEFLEKLKNIKSLSQVQKNKYETRNCEIFNQLFTSSNFANNYINLINSLK